MATSSNRTIVYDSSLFNGYSEYLISDRPFGTLIYRARSTSGHGNDHALKVVPRYAMVQRRPHNIRKEAAILASLNHSNIVELLSAFYDAGKEIYEIHMQFINLPLSTLLAHPKFSAHPLPQGLHIPSQDPFFGIPPQTLHAVLSKSIAFQILHAIEYLHGQNPPIAHRDINPSNFLFTRDGVLKLVDFGVAWDPSLSQRPFNIVGEDPLDSQQDADDWEESARDMCCQVATGSYRAPELMYNLKEYDACATDIWSLGVMIAQLFTPLRLELYNDSEDSEEEDSSSSNSDSQEQQQKQDPWPGYQLPKKLTITLENDTATVPTHSTWQRDPLFDSSRGEIGLLWSIFKLMGTPTKESWPDFPGHQPDAAVRFRDAPKQPLLPCLPHIQLTNLAPLDIIERLLTYPPRDRMSANEALNHTWFKTGNQHTDSAEPILLPAPGVYQVDRLDGISAVHELNGHSLSELLRDLVEDEEQRFQQDAVLRDEWD